MMDIRMTDCHLEVVYEATYLFHLWQLFFSAVEFPVVNHHEILPLREQRAKFVEISSQCCWVITG